MELQSIILGFGGLVVLILMANFIKQWAMSVKGADEDYKIYQEKIRREGK